MSRSQIERRLSDALQARADSVGLDDLRPAVPPTEAGRSFLPTRRTAVVLFGLAAAIASIVLVLTQRHPTTPVNPADNPSTSRSSSPSTSPTATAVPVPSGLPASPISPASPVYPASPAPGTVHPASPAPSTVRPALPFPSAAAPPFPFATARP